LNQDSPFAYEYATRPSVTTASDLQRRLASEERPRKPRNKRELSDALLARPDLGVLVLLEAVNAGGKDGTIEELTRALGPDRLRIERIKRRFHPGGDQDLLEVAATLVPTPGELVFFNRSYYEDAVHSSARGRPDAGPLCGRIAVFEEQLASKHVKLVKLFLHIDKGEQLRRLEARERHRHLRHLHNPFDRHDQRNWASLMRAYDSVLALTHTRASPWSMIPGNDRRFRNNAVEDVLLSALR